MSVDQSNIIDAIGTDNDTNSVILTIIDHLIWDNEGKHLLILQDKLNTYLSFIESGELEFTYPASIGKKNVIDLVCKFPIDINGIFFSTKPSQLWMRLE